MNEDMKTTLHNDEEVAKFQLDIGKRFILLMYENLAKHWWWEGLDIAAKVDQDPSIPKRYILHQTEDSAEYDPFKHPTKPYKLGYLEIAPVESSSEKPVEVKLVCSWSTVISFWEELEIILKRNYTEIPKEEKPTNTVAHKKAKVPDDIYIPETPASLMKWEKIWDLYNKSSKHVSYQDFGNWLDSMYPALPSSRETIGLVIKAGKAGLLDKKENKKTDIGS